MVSTKTTFIPVTVISKDYPEGHTHYICPYWVASIMRNLDDETTLIYFHLNVDDPMIVKETPEEIIELIKREENRLSS